MWQDYALSLISACFIITLIPAVLRNYKLKDVKGQSIHTYLSTALLLTLMSGVYFSMEFYLSGITASGTGLMWYILSYQKIKYSKFS